MLNVEENRSLTRERIAMVAIKVVKVVIELSMKEGREGWKLNNELKKKAKCILIRQHKIILNKSTVWKELDIWRIS